MKNLLCATTLLLGSFVATSAFAMNPLQDPTAIPPAPAPGTGTGTFHCDGALDPADAAANMQYDIGFTSSYLMTWGAWANSGQSRNDVVTFLDTAESIALASINGGISNLSSLPAWMDVNSPGCRFHGNIAGVSQAVADILSSVIMSCGIEGTYIGNFQGTLYCALAATVPATQIPVVIPVTVARNTGTCSSVYEPACEGAFGAQTDATCPAYKADNDPATNVDWLGYHDASRHNACTFL